MTGWTPPAPIVPGMTALATAEAKAKAIGEEMCADLPNFAFVCFIATPDGNYVTNTTNLSPQALLKLLHNQMGQYLHNTVAPAGKLAKGSTH